MLVKAKLVAPRDAIFAKEGEYTNQMYPNAGATMLNSWVDSPNVMGVMLRTHFECIYRHSDNVVELTFEE